MGFVDFENAEEATAAVDATSEGVSIDGNHVNVQLARPKNHIDSAAGRRLRTVYVGNLDFNTEDWQLEDFFSRVGAVKEVRVPRTPEGRGRGFGFVTFMEIDDALTAVEHNGENFQGRTITIAKQEKTAPRERY